MKLTFLGFDKKTVLKQASQNQVDMLHVFFLRLCKKLEYHHCRQRGIYSIQHVPEHIIDEGLENSGGIGITRYSKWPRRVLNAVFHSSPWRIRTR